MSANDGYAGVRNSERSVQTVGESCSSNARFPSFVFKHRWNMHRGFRCSKLELRGPRNDLNIAPQSSGG
eukprot:4305617-Alexandrium_andersonii.AAC.1